MNYITVIDDIFKQFSGPKFTIEFWDGKKKHYGNGTISSFILRIADENTAKRLLAQGSIGFGESYMNGSIQIDGDLEAYLRLRHQFKRVKKSARLLIASYLATKSIPIEREKQIAHHYDKGNDFFLRILDNETMSYSAGIYQTENESLDVAQIKKFDYVCKLLSLPKQAKVLDLGSGWGGFANYASKHYHYHVTGYTLSKEQLEYSQQIIKQNTVQFIYKDMTKLNIKSRYDAVIVLESLEHVGQAHIYSFIQSIYKILKPGGKLFIQTTGRYLPKKVDQWTLKYIFPGGYLPTRSELLSVATTAGFGINLCKDHTDDYVLTITQWLQNLKKNQRKIEKEYGKSFYNMWNLFLHGAKVNFELGEMSLFRMLLTKPK